MLNPTAGGIVTIPITITSASVGATYLTTTYASLPWARRQVPTLVAPVLIDVSISEGETLAFAIENRNSVAVNCYVEIFDDTGAEVFSGECKISANGVYAYGVDLTSSYYTPYEINLEFTASGYTGSNSVDYVS
jgi:hypothetical protein